MRYNKSKELVSNKYFFAFGRYAVLAAISIALFVPELKASSAAFLKIPVGVRPASLGGAFSAYRGDANSIAYNPAGLAFLSQPSASLMHANYIGGLSHDWLVYAHPYKNTVNAIGINSLSIKSIDGYAYDGQPSDPVSASDLALYFAHARKISDKIGFGVNLKYVSERLDTEKANAFAADLGILAETPVSGLDFAMVAENIGTRMKFIEDKFSLPSRAKAGFLYRKDIFNLKCAYSADMVVSVDGRRSFLIGTEAALNERFFFRGGWQNLRDLGSPLTYGLGYRFNAFGKTDMSLDYAFADYGEFGNVHRFGLTLRFTQRRAVPKAVVVQETVSPVPASPVETLEANEKADEAAPEKTEGAGE